MAAAVLPSRLAACFALAALAIALAFGQTGISVSPQQPPFPLPKGIALYSGTVCGAARIVSAGQIRQAIELAGLSVQDPILNTPTLAKGAGRTVISILSGILTYGGGGVAVGGAITAAIKSSNVNIGNAKTWAEIAAVSGALGAGVPLAQTLLKPGVEAQATITNGVQAALLSPDGLYSIPAGGCSKPFMFFGLNDRTKPFQAVIP